MQGMVKWFNNKKGYGFIVCEGKDYFVHVNDVQRNVQLNEGDKVNFETQEAKKGVKAVNVRRIG